MKYNLTLSLAIFIIFIIKMKNDEKRLKAYLNLLYVNAFIEIYNEITLPEHSRVC